MSVRVASTLTLSVGLGGRGGPSSPRSIPSVIGTEKNGVDIISQVLPIRPEEGVGGEVRGKRWGTVPKGEEVRD